MACGCLALPGYQNEACPEHGSAHKPFEETLVDEVFAANPKQVEDYRAGNEKAFNSLVGQIMKASKGSANPARVNELLRRRLAPHDCKKEFVYSFDGGFCRFCGANVPLEG